MVWAINGKLYLDGKEIYSLLDDSKVQKYVSIDDIGPSLFSLQSAYFREDYVLFFLTFYALGENTQNGLIVKYDRTNHSSSIIFSFDDAPEIQKMMFLIAASQNINDFMFEIKHIINYYFTNGLIIPMRRLYYLFSNQNEGIDVNP